jgi:hypothetical protein
MANRFQQMFAPTDMSGYAFYTPNTNLMTKVLGAQQQRLDNALAASEKYFDVIDVQPDIEARDKIMKDARSSVDNIYDTFRMRGIEAGNEALSKFEREQRRLYGGGGEAFNLTKSLEQYQAHIKRLDELVDKKEMSTSRAEFAKQYSKQLFSQKGGTKGYGLYSGITPPNEVDLDEVLDKALTGFSSVYREGRVKSDLRGHFKIEKRDQSNKTAMVDHAMATLQDPNVLESLQFEAMMAGLTDPDDVKKYVSNRISKSVQGAVNKHATDKISSDYVKDWVMEEQISWNRQQEAKRQEEELKRRANYYFDSGSFKQTNVVGKNVDEVTTKIQGTTTRVMGQTKRILANDAIKQQLLDWQAANPNQEIDPKRLLFLVGNGTIDPKASETLYEDIEVLKDLVSEENHLNEALSAANEYAKSTTKVDPAVLERDFFGIALDEYVKISGTEDYIYKKRNPITGKEEEHTIPVSVIFNQLKKGTAILEEATEKVEEGRGTRRQIPNVKVTLADGTVLDNFGQTSSIFGRTRNGPAFAQAINNVHKKQKSDYKKYNKSRNDWLANQNAERTVEFTTDPWFIEENSLANAVKDEVNEFYQNTANLPDIIMAQEHLDTDTKNYLVSHLTELTVGAAGFSAEAGREHNGQFDLITGFKITVPDPERYYKDGTQRNMTNSYQIIVNGDMAGPEVLKRLKHDPRVITSSIFRRMRDQGTTRHVSGEGVRYSIDENGGNVMAYQDFNTGLYIEGRVNSTLDAYLDSQASKDRYQYYNRISENKIDRDDYSTIVVPLLDELGETGNTKDYFRKMKDKGYTQSQATLFLQYN